MDCRVPVEPTRGTQVVSFNKRVQKWLLGHVAFEQDPGGEAGICGAQRHGVKPSQEKKLERDSVLRLKEPRVLRLEDRWL